MKVQFFCDSGANIHSCHKSGILDTVKDLGLDDDEWEALSDNEKYKLAEEWANNYLEIYFEES
ncbi:MAG: hypothetical protein WC315_00820 [Candidatus Omnitrophota bacterium]|jgi:hypothetical protein